MDGVTGRLKTGYSARRFCGRRFVGFDLFVSILFRGDGGVVFTYSASRKKANQSSDSCQRERRGGGKF
jgi:hypothetical protein